MKKTLLIAAGIMLVAAGCTKTASQTNQNQNQNPPSQNQQATSTPDQTSNWNTYTAPAKYGFSIKYPTDFGFNTDYTKVNSVAGSYIPVCDQNTVACAFLVRNTYPNTNFDGAGVSINIDPSLNTEAKCYNFAIPTNEAQQPVSDVTINGTTFKSAVGGGAATGHSDKVQVYRNFHNNTCYEIAQRVSQTAIGNYPKDTVQPFDSDAVWAKLQGVVNTFEFINSASSITYNNTQYNFAFALPQDWKGYTIVNDTWQGYKMDEQKGEVPAGTGPFIRIRNPHWTSTNHYEDIPIMVFTLAQWNDVSNGNLIVSAAPINPAELGRNSKYVFALPARYNYDYATGWEEVEQIFQNHPLQAN